MKQLLIILLFLFPFTTIAQHSTPVRWEVATKEKKKNIYEIRVNAIIEPSWYVYAADDNPSGLEAVRTSFETKKIIPGEIITLIPTELIYDPVFSKNQRVFKNIISFVQEIGLSEPIYSIDIHLYAFASNASEFIAVDTTIQIILDPSAKATLKENSIILSGIDLTKPLAACGDGVAENKGLLAIFFLGVAGGLLALITPCVFPLIPVTVSYFTCRSSNPKASYQSGILYGIFILMIYVLASFPFHLLGGISPEIFNTISTNSYVNIFFFLVFILFALSLFGVFDIRLPSFLSNSAGSRGGIFFMALTLAIVSFSCTGPILGTLLVGSLSARGDAWQLTAGLAGFGLALGLPFSLFALFPSWLKALPKSGDWMEIAKKSLAFVELALAIKFLSNADLVEHWGILKREIFIGLWLLIALVLALYLFGVFEKKKIAGLQNTDKMVYQKIPLTRKIISLIVVAFAIYLVPGLTPSEYSNLKLLSGFPPPHSYSIYNKKNKETKSLEPDFVNDYETAISLSKKSNKPLLIDFTGWACVNCRKMEEQVWTKKEIKNLILENFILVSLYVDDRKKLPDGTTIGKKWANFQSANFGQVTQPLHVILSPDEKLINYPLGYTPSGKEYKEWLKCGLAAFKKNEMVLK
jgi:thiol:disulfide interchange protein